MALLTYTFTDLKNKFKEIVRDPTYARYEQPSVEKALNTAYVSIVMSKEFSFRETSSDIAITVDVNTFTLPTDYDQTNPAKLNVYWDEVDEDKKLAYIFAKDNPDASRKGTPLGWYKFASTGYLYPKPSASGTLIFQYYKIPEILSAGTDEPLIPAAFADVIAWKAALDSLPASDSNFANTQLQYNNKYNDLCYHLIVNSEDNKQTQVSVASSRGNLLW